MVNAGLPATAETKEFTMWTRLLIPARDYCSARGICLPWSANSDCKRSPGMLEAEQGRKLCGERYKHTAPRAA